MACSEEHLKRVVVKQLVIDHLLWEAGDFVLSTYAASR